MMANFNLRKAAQVIFLIGAVLAVFNYDVAAVKILKYAPRALENRLAAEFMPGKFWLHRVNSPGKQKEFAHKYQGLEFDIIYYEKDNAFVLVGRTEMV